MAKSAFLSAVLFVSVAMGGGASAAIAETASAQLSGINEVPAVMTQGKGLFQATLRTSSINYRLLYANLEGQISQAHLHIAQSGVNGGIVVFLCQTQSNPAPVAGVPVCPGTTDGAVLGTLRAASVIGPVPQNIRAGDFDKVLLAIRQGVAYVNVHTTLLPAGEIRGQVKINP